MSSFERTTVLHTRIVSGTGGGPEKTILNSARHLEGTPYRALAAYMHAPGDAGIEVLRARAHERRCPFFAFEDKLPVDPRTLQALAELCRRENVRIWHGHDYKSNLYGLLLARLVDVKLATTVHGWVKHTDKTPLYFAIDRWCLRRYESVVAVSRDLYDECVKIGVASARLTQIDNAIDTTEFKRARPARESPLRRALSAATTGASHSAEFDRAEFGSAEFNSAEFNSATLESVELDSASRNRLVIGAVGRLSAEKGFAFLIEAVERLIARGRDVELWIAGEGEEQAALEARIQRSPAKSRLRLLGFQKDTLALFEAFDIFALSSLREGLPNVVLEAMAMEVPVVATRCGGMEAFGRDGVDMLLVDKGSVDALERGLERVIVDAELRTKLSHAARDRIAREFSFTRRMQKMIAVYDELLVR